MLGDSYIVNLVKGFHDRNVSTKKISFGLLRTNILKKTLHWAQDFWKIRRTPSLVSISNADKVCTTIEAAKHRDRIRKHSLEELASLSKAADPGKLK